MWNLQEVQLRIFDFSNYQCIKNSIQNVYVSTFDTTICEITEYFYGLYFFFSKTRRTYV